jgi:hypothetical protein
MHCFAAIPLQHSSERTNDPITQWHMLSSNSSGGVSSRACAHLANFAELFHTVEAVSSRPASAVCDSRVIQFCGHIHLKWHGMAPQKRYRGKCAHHGTHDAARTLLRSACGVPARCTMAGHMCCDAGGGHCGPHYRTRRTVGRLAPLSLKSCLVSAILPQTPVFPQQNDTHHAQKMTPN